MNKVLDSKIEKVLDSADRMFIATSVVVTHLGHQYSLVEMERILYFSHLTPQEKLNKLD